MNYWRKAIDWLLEGFRTLYPFCVCWIGGLVFAVGWSDETKGAALTVTIIAGFSFVWAIDLAYARGKAKGESEVAAKIAAFLTTGDSTEINVNINHSRQA
jgi:hypothetical protein